LLAEGLLQAPHFSQPDIMQLDKTALQQTNADFFSGLLNQGFLLLNASLVLHPQAASGQVRKDARAWQPFLQNVIDFLLTERPQVQFILFGKVAAVIEELIPAREVKKLCAEHPYNHSFITNQEVLHFFQPLHLLRKTKSSPVAIFP
jgi:uracil-DNA glycosylase